MIRSFVWRLALGSTAMLACDQGSQGAPARAALADVPPTAQITSCLEAIAMDSMLFSNVERSSETGDQSGTEYRFECTESGRWRGEVRLARGELGAPTTVTIETMSHLSDSLRFHFGTGDALTTFDGRISCDSIWGRVSMFDSAVVVSRTYRRNHAERSSCRWFQRSERERRDSVVVTPAR